MTFRGKVALVAGGTGGLGRAVSLAFQKEGAELIVAYRKDQELNDLKSMAGTNASALVGCNSVANRSQTFSTNPAQFTSDLHCWLPTSR